MELTSLGLRCVLLINNPYVRHCEYNHDGRPGGRGVRGEDGDIR